MLNAYRTPEKCAHQSFHGLMVEYAKSIDATCVLRGIERERLRI